MYFNGGGRNDGAFSSSDLDASSDNVRNVIAFSNNGACYNWLALSDDRACYDGLDFSDDGFDHGRSCDSDDWLLDDGLLNRHVSHYNGVALSKRSWGFASSCGSNMFRLTNFMVSRVNGRALLLNYRYRLDIFNTSS